MILSFILAILEMLGNINGHYVSLQDANHYDEGIYFDIQKIDNNNIKFQANSYWTGADPENIHTGVIAGIIPLKNGKAVYEDNFGDPTDVYDPKQPDKFQGCHAEIIFKPDSTIRVDDNYRCGGANVTFMGDYKRKSFIIPDWSIFDTIK